MSQHRECPKCGSIIDSIADTCKFCKTVISEADGQEEKKVQNGLCEREERNSVAKEAEIINKESKYKSILQNYGLDVENYSNDQIKDANIKNIKSVGSELAGSGWLKAGLALSFQPYERQSLGYLSALMEQNWILIRQNELIIRLLDKDKKPKK